MHARGMINWRCNVCLHLNDTNYDFLKKIKPVYWTYNFFYFQYVNNKKNGYKVLFVYYITLLNISDMTND